AAVVAVDAVAITGWADSFRETLEGIVLGQAGAEHDGVQLVPCPKSMVDAPDKGRIGAGIGGLVGDIVGRAGDGGSGHVRQRSVGEKRGASGVDARRDVVVGKE